ncbi:hypothetical protein [Alkalicoccobacillus plakortidis]|uniref:Uncharacterized protein n=1 Tax=Alkalicoccobacillus plakortidis TaxID=444060 RepID=A0ABT0XGU7_9BACI|nr:hypothetical protein [Alkalicoccobacillus plakortidis]MCM2674548.1 hypothetical protein [Alkalicoccobacillus plakortidis]
MITIDSNVSEDNIGGTIEVTIGAMTLMSKDDYIEDIHAAWDAFFQLLKEETCQFVLKGGRTTIFTLVTGTNGVQLQVKKIDLRGMALTLNSGYLSEQVFLTTLEDAYHSIYLSKK